jgi:hypothetical protein
VFKINFYKFLIENKMNKKVVLFTIASMFLASIAFSQAPAVNPNAEHDKMIGLIQKSEMLPVPEFVTVALKKFAKEKGYDEKAILRNALLLSPIYNTSLTKEERLFACKIALRACENTYATIPASLVTKMMNEISSK